MLNSGVGSSLKFWRHPGPVEHSRSDSESPREIGLDRMIACAGGEPTSIGNADLHRPLGGNGTTGRNRPIA
jgi:hypothetical protein